ncbi:MAG: EFR1 family ferrodoxin [Eubacteriales bacterium]
MTITTFYFSGTGNTQWAVSTLNQRLTSVGHHADAYPIENQLSDDQVISLLESSDVLGFAYPLYGANIPRIMRQFIHRIISLARTQGLNKKNIFLVNTFGYVNGHGIFCAKKVLQDSPFKIVGYINLRLTNSAPSKTKGRAFVGRHLPDHFKQNAGRKLSQFVKRLNHGQRMINGIGPHLLVGMLIRHILREEINANYKNMRVDMNKCTRCLLCVKQCPTKSITHYDGQFSFSSTCEACMRCYHLCPTEAISNFKS